MRSSPVYFEFEVLELSEKHLKLQIHNSDHTVMDRLRRNTMNGIKTMAITTVNIYKNESQTLDDQLKEKFYLIPLKSDILPNVNPLFKVDVIGSKTKTLVTTVDIVQLTNTEVEPIRYSYSYGIPITNIGDNKRLHVEMYAEEGTGGDWSPVVESYFVYLADITLSDLKRGLSEEKKREFVSSCPTGVYKINEESNEIDIEDISLCTQCQMCTNYLREEELPEFATVNAKVGEFIFFINSREGLSAGSIFTKATIKLVEDYGIDRLQINYDLDEEVYNIEQLYDGVDVILDPNYFF